MIEGLEGIKILTGTIITRETTYSATISTIAGFITIVGAFMFFFGILNLIIGFFKEKYFRIVGLTLIIIGLIVITLYHPTLLKSYMEYEVTPIEKNYFIDENIYKITSINGEKITIEKEINN